MWYKTKLLKDLPDVAAGAVLYWDDGLPSPFMKGPKASFINEDGTMESLYDASRPKMELFLVYPPNKGTHQYDEDSSITNKCNEILKLYNRPEWTETLLDIDRLPMMCPYCHKSHLLIGRTNYLMTPSNKEAIFSTKRNFPTFALADVALCPHCGKWSFTGTYFTLENNPLSVTQIEDDTREWYYLIGLSMAEVREHLDLLKQGTQVLVLNKEMKVWFQFYKEKVEKAEKGFKEINRMNISYNAAEEYPIEGLVPPPTREEWLNSLLDEDISIPPEYSGEPSPQEMLDTRMDAVYGGWE